LKEIHASRKWGLQEFVEGTILYNCLIYQNSIANSFEHCNFRIVENDFKKLGFNSIFGCKESGILAKT